MVLASWGKGVLLGGSCPGLGGSSAGLGGSSVNLRGAWSCFRMPGCGISVEILFV